VTTSFGELVMNVSYATRFRQQAGSESTHVPTMDRADRRRSSSARVQTPLLFGANPKRECLFGQPTTPATLRLPERWRRCFNSFRYCQASRWRDI